MKKQIDNYILEKKIGSGQFGEVFKGIDTLKQQPVAIKAIKRENLKGKFVQLLQNEIKVLQTCDNPNIIKLYDIKKTANNFYLILEYCNQGDLHTYLRQRRILSQNESVKYFLEILNGFKTLVKNKIMHRDFKLANVLKHDGNIKIADFGFSKLLSNEDYASTILGSPLNMAPEVLQGNQYNNKADIWSIGTVFYELLFGRTPYFATNIVELIATIKKKQLQFPHNINKISQITEDILKKMLVINPKERIQWTDLFNHPIVNFFEKKLNMNTNGQIHSGSNQNVQTSCSIQEQQSNKQIVITQNLPVKNENFSLAKKLSLEGEIHKQKTQIITNKIDLQKQKEKDEKSFKRNMIKLFHYRNLYLFLATLAEETLNNVQIKLSDLLGYFLVKKLLDIVRFLKKIIEGEISLKQMENWSKFTKHKDYFQIRQYVMKEYTAFYTFHINAFNRIMKQKEKIRSFNCKILTVIEDQQGQINQDVLKNIIIIYVKEYIMHLKQQPSPSKSIDKILKQWKHLDQILDITNFQIIFKQCDLKEYKDRNINLSLQDLIKKVEQKFLKVESSQFHSN